jgi:hypothetical protein
VIAALLDTLLPGDAAFPPAGAVMGVAERVVALAGPVLAALPRGFDAADQVRREEMLRAVEASAPAAFERFVAAVYVAYYTVPAVQAVLERSHGHAARPPQPEGHVLAPFDDAMLARQRVRAPFWRQA